MGLSYDDLLAIRKVVEETVDLIKGELTALRNDIKEIQSACSSIWASFSYL
jgi:hypothetical protein